MGSSMAIGAFILGSWWLLPRWWKMVSAITGSVFGAYLWHIGSEWVDGQDRWVILAKTVKEMPLPWKGAGFGYVTDRLPGWSKQIGVLPFKELHNDWIEGLYALGVGGMAWLVLGVLRGFFKLDRIGQAMIIAIGFNALANFPFHLAPIVLLVIPVIGKGINSVDDLLFIDRIKRKLIWRKL